VWDVNNNWQDTHAPIAEVLRQINDAMCGQQGRNPMTAKIHLFVSPYAIVHGSEARPMPCGIILQKPAQRMSHNVEKLGLPELGTRLWLCAKCRKAAEDAFNSEQSASQPYEKLRWIYGLVEGQTAHDLETKEYHASRP
jgi:hypothetical protein